MGWSRKSRPLHGLGDVHVGRQRSGEACSPRASIRARVTRGNRARGLAPDLRCGTDALKAVLMDARPEQYYRCAWLVSRLNPDTDYTVNEMAKSADLTEEGARKIEEWTGVASTHVVGRTVLAQMINQALRAHSLYLVNRDYIVRDGAVIIVDEFSGRTMPARRWSGGLHQAIEAKEGVRVRPDEGDTN
jgi:hypothetical protein